MDTEAVKSNKISSTPLIKAINPVKKEGSDIKIFRDNKALHIYANGEMIFLDDTKKEATCWRDLDHNGKYDTKIIFTIGGKDKPVVSKLDEAQNDVKKIQQQVITECKKEIINGKIDDFEQGNTGDCWLLAGLKALSGTKKGAEAIKQSISEDNDGNVTVKLKGVNETYTFSSDEIYNAKGKKADGDPDVIAFELAIEKHKEQVFKNHTSRGLEDYKNRLGRDPSTSALDGGSSAEVFAILTNKQPYIFSASKKTEEDRNNIMAIQAELLQKQAAPDKIALGVSFLNEDGPMHVKHAYSVEKVDKDYVTVTNPWDSLKEIKIKKADFIKNCKTISFLNMDSN